MKDINENVYQNNQMVLTYEIIRDKIHIPRKGIKTNERSMHMADKNVDNNENKSEKAASTSQDTLTAYFLNNIMLYQFNNIEIMFPNVFISFHLINTPPGILPITYHKAICLKLFRQLLNSSLI